MLLQIVSVYIGHANLLSCQVLVYYYYYYYWPQLSCYCITVVLTLVKTKQRRINIHKRKNTKNSVQTIQIQYNTIQYNTIQIHIARQHPHITKRVYTHSHSLHNAHIHTTILYKTSQNNHNTRNTQLNLRYGMWKGPCPCTWCPTIFPVSLYSPVKFSSGSLPSTVMFLLSKSNLWTEKQLWIGVW